MLATADVRDEKSSGSRPIAVISSNFIQDTEAEMIDIKMKKVVLLLVGVFILAGCGPGTDDSQVEVQEADVKESDPDIPSEAGHFNAEWSATDDSFSFSVGADQFEPPSGGTGVPGALWRVSDGSGSVAAGGQLNFLWQNPDDSATEEDPSELNLAVNYGISADRTLEPGTYEVASAQTSDGMPWLNGSNDPKLRYSSSNRRYGDRTNGSLIIDEVTDTNAKGRLIVTGAFLQKEGTFRLAIAFNAYKE